MMCLTNACNLVRRYDKWLLYLSHLSYLPINGGKNGSNHALEAWHCLRIRAKTGVEVIPVSVSCCLGDHIPRMHLKAVQQ